MHYSGNMDLTFLFEDLQVQSSVGKDFFCRDTCLLCSFFFSNLEFSHADFACKFTTDLWLKNLPRVHLPLHCCANRFSSVLKMLRSLRRNRLVRSRGVKHDCMAVFLSFFFFSTLFAKKILIFKFYMNWSTENNGCRCAHNCSVHFPKFFLPYLTFSSLGLHTLQLVISCVCDCCCYALIFAYFVL